MWVHYNTYHTKIGKNIKCNIAAFDLDYTLIKPKSGRKFPKDKNDWKFLFDNIIDYLHSLKDYSIILFTNQSRFNDNIIEKIDNIIEKINLDIHVFISSGKDYYRKPMTGMWEELMSINPNIDLNNSFYCGDAAGRKNDFSASDYYFANNIGIKFILPEVLFKSDNFDFEKLKYNYKLTSKFDKYITDIETKIPISNKKERNELVFMIGYPGSGKSYITKKLNYIIINQDTLKTKSKCVSCCKEAMKKNKNIVIDNLNYSISSRKSYFDLAKKNNYYIRCIIIDNDIDFCMHMNYCRTQMSHGEKKLIPNVVYYTMRKKYEEPTNVNQIDKYTNLIQLNNEYLLKCFNYTYL